MDSGLLSSYEGAFVYCPGARTFHVADRCGPNLGLFFAALKSSVRSPLPSGIRVLWVCTPRTFLSV